MKTLIWFTILTLWYENSHCSLHNSDYKVLKDLFNNYDKDVRPVLNATVPITVNVHMLLVQIDSLSWYDPSLTWNSSDYNKVTHITVKKSKVWTPPIGLLNRASLLNGETYGNKFEDQVSITSDGKCILTFSTFFKSTCEINVSNFPFDAQTCELWFGSWSMDESMLILQNDNTVAAELNHENGEWRLKSAFMQKQKNRYKIQKRDFNILIIKCELERKYLFYTMNLLMPCALLASMTFLVFILPPKSGERVTLSITVMLSMAVFQELSSAKLPSSSDNYPIFGIYYSTSMFEIGIALVINCLILNIYYRGDEVPSWLRYLIFGKLSKIVFVTIPEHIKLNIQQNKKSKNKINKKLDYSITESETCINLNVLSNDNTIGIDDLKPSDTIVLTERDSFKGIYLERTDSIKNDGSVIKHKLYLGPTLSLSGSLNNEMNPVNDREMKNEDNLENSRNRKRDIEEEWQLVSRVIDRIMLFVAVFIGVLSALTIFAQAERFREIFTA